jgi:archaellum component FlaC
MGQMADSAEAADGQGQAPLGERLPEQSAVPLTPEVVKAEESLSEKVGTLRDELARISERVESQQKWGPEQYLQSLETLRQQVDSIHAEWESVTAKSRAQRDQLESLLQTFPGAIETATLRVNQLESLVSVLIDEKDSRDNSSRARKQMIISLVALGVTVILWGVWIILSVTR